MKIALICLFTLISCQIPSSSSGQEDEKEKFNWTVLEKLFSNAMDKQKIKTVLGTPKEIFEKTQTKDEFWIYEDIESKSQLWGISFDSKDFVKKIIYTPLPYEKKDFSLEIILEKWKTFDCKKESIQKISPDLVKTQNLIVCKGGRKIFLNKEDDVSSLQLEF